jgi:hypothetical protein
MDWVKYATILWLLEEFRWLKAVCQYGSICDRLKFCLLAKFRPLYTAKDLMFGEDIGFGAT